MSTKDLTAEDFEATVTETPSSWSFWLRGVALAASSHLSMTRLLKRMPTLSSARWTRRSAGTGCHGSDHFHPNAYGIP